MHERGFHATYGRGILYVRYRVTVRTYSRRPQGRPLLGAPDQASEIRSRDVRAAFPDRFFGSGSRKGEGSGRWSFAETTNRSFSARWVRFASSSALPKRRPSRRRSNTTILAR